MAALLTGIVDRLEWKQAPFSRASVINPPAVDKNPIVQVIPSAKCEALRKIEESLLNPETSTPLIQEFLGKYSMTRNKEWARPKTAFGKLLSDVPRQDRPAVRKIFEESFEALKGSSAMMKEIQFSPYGGQLPMPEELIQKLQDPPPGTIYEQLGMSRQSVMKRMREFNDALPQLAEQWMEEVRAHPDTASLEATSLALEGMSAEPPRGLLSRLLGARRSNAETKVKNEPRGPTP